LSMGLFFLLAMKFYYRQNWFKTFFKFVLLITAYIFLGGVFVSLTSVISFFIYQ
jgi:hypothetical protein